MYGSAREIITHLGCLLAAFRVAEQVLHAHLQLLLLWEVGARVRFDGCNVSDVMIMHAYALKLVCVRRLKMTSCMI